MTKLQEVRRQLEEHKKTYRGREAEHESIVDLARVANLLSSLLHEEGGNRLLVRAYEEEVGD